MHIQKVVTWETTEKEGIAEAMVAMSVESLSSDTKAGVGVSIEAAPISSELKGGTGASSRGKEVSRQGSHHYYRVCCAPCNSIQDQADSARS